MPKKPEKTLSVQVDALGAAIERQVGLDKEIDRLGRAMKTAQTLKQTSKINRVTSSAQKAQQAGMDKFADRMLKREGAGKGGGREI